MKKLFCVLSLMLLIVPVCFALEEETAQTTSIFERWDRDGDGRVTAEEKKARVEIWFAEVDIDGDGKITLDEKMAATDRMFDEADLAGDGYITVTEYLMFFCGETELEQEVKAKKTVLEKTGFKRHDKNNDGYITVEECVAVRRVIFEAKETDSDGRLSKDELRADAEARFNAADSSGSTYIVLEEWIAFYVGTEHGEPAKKEKKQ